MERCYTIETTETGFEGLLAFETVEEALKFKKNRICREVKERKVFKTAQEAEEYLNKSRARSIAKKVTFEELEYLREHIHELTHYSVL